MITAGGIKTSSKLKDALEGIGNPQRGAISGAYRNKSNQLLADARPGAKRMLDPGTYGAETMAAGEGFSQGNLLSGLEGVLGDSAYTDFKLQRDYDQNYALSKMAGELMQPSGLQEALSALNTGIGTIAQGYGAFKNMPKSKMTKYQPSSAPSYDRYTSGGSGLNLIG